MEDFPITPVVGSISLEDSPTIHSTCTILLLAGENNDSRH